MPGDEGAHVSAAARAVTCGNNVAAAGRMGKLTSNSTVAGRDASGLSISVQQRPPYSERARTASLKYPRSVGVRLWLSWPVERNRDSCMFSAGVLSWVNAVHPLHVPGKFLRGRLHSPRLSKKSLNERRRSSQPRHSSHSAADVGSRSIKDSPIGGQISPLPCRASGQTSSQGLTPFPAGRVLVPGEESADALTGRHRAHSGIHGRLEIVGADL